MPRDSRVYVFSALAHGPSFERLDSCRLSAAMLFCINPASIFFSAFYSESLFAFVTFAALLALAHQDTLKAMLFVAMSSGARSNATVTAGT